MEEQSEIKLYRHEQTLCYLDSTIYDLAHAEIQLGIPAKVVAADGRSLGFASLERRGDRVVANIAIDYASEERFLAQARTQDLYLHPYGSMAVSSLPMFDFHSPLTPTYLSIDGIVISPRKPSDGRLVPFGRFDR